MKSTAANYTKRGGHWTTKNTDNAEEAKGGEDKDRRRLTQPQTDSD